MKAAIILGSIAVLWGCSYQIPESKHKIDYSKVQRMSENNLAPRFGNLEVDTFRIDGTQMSLDGQLFTVRDTLCFADYILGSVLFYDTTGQFISSAITKGRGPNEVLSMNSITTSPEGHIVIDGNWTLYEINPQWKITKKGRLKWPPILDEQECIKHPDPNDGAIYELSLSKYPFRVYDKKHVVFVICTDHVNFNGYNASDHASEYYKEAYNIGIFSRDSLKMERMLCNYPPIYKEYRFLSTFKDALFEIQNHDLIFSFQPDSNLYVMDLRDSVIQSFGHAGIDMNTKYPEYLTIEDSDNNLDKDEENYGHYRYLYFEPQSGLFFRGYRKGASPLPDGLQVYKDYQYVGDYDVPRDFKVVGYIAPYFYAYGGVDYDTEELIVYRFKLPDYE